MIIYDLDVDSRLKNIIIKTGDKQNKKTAVKKTNKTRTTGKKNMMINT